MPANSHPLLGEVSCRATSYVIEQLERMGLATAHLTRNLSLSLDNLRKASNSITWDDFLVFVENSNVGLTPEQVVALCVSYKGSRPLRPLLSAAGIWFHPARYYSWICDSDSGAIQQLFRCLTSRYTVVDDRQVLLELTLRPGYQLPPDYFWESQAIAFGALTSYFGLPDSIVTWEPIDRGAAFTVRLPRKRFFRHLFSKMFSWFLRDVSEDVRSALTYGHERAVRLEIEIQERKKVETALRATERRFQQVTDSIPGVVYRFVLTPEGKDALTYISAGIRELTGHTPAEVMADTRLIWSSIHPDDLAGYQNSVAASASGKRAWSREYRLVSKDGSIRWVRSRAVPESDGAGAGLAWNGIMIDITAERLASDALRESEERWKFALEGSGAGVLEWDIATGRMYFSEQWRKMAGFTVESVPARFEDLTALVHPDDLGPAVAALEACLSGERRTMQAEHRLRRADGSWIWIEANGLVIRRDNIAQKLIGTHTDISDRRRFEEQLRASDALLRKLSQQVPGVIYQFQRWPDGKSCFPYASEGIREIYEVSPREARLSAELVFHRIHPEDLDRVAETILRSAASMEPWRCEYRVNLPERGLRWLEGHSVPEGQADGSILWHGHINDVTDRVLTEQARRESEERLSAVIRHTPNVAIQWFDADARAVLWNEASELLYGYPAGEAVGRGIEELILAPDQAEVFRNSIAFIRRTGQSVGPTEFAFRRRDGREGVCLSSIFKIPGEGAGERFACMDVDITDRKEAEEALRQSTKRLALAVGATSDAIWEWNYQTGETYYSLRWYEMLGCDSSLPMSFETWKSLCHPDDVQPTMDQIALVISSPHSEGYSTEFRMRRADGSWVWILGRGNVVERDRDGHPRVLAGTNTDITERKRIEAELRASRDRLDFLVSSSPAVIYTAKTSGDYAATFVSGNVLSLTGHEAGRFVNEPDYWSRHLHPEDAPRILQGLRRLPERGRHTCEYRFRSPDGTYRWMQDQSVLLRDSLGNPTEIIGYWIDVTKRKRAEEDLRESEARSRLAIEAASLGIWRFDSASGEVEFDARAKEFLGIDRSVVLPGELRDLLGEQTYQRLEALGRHAADSESPGVFDSEQRVVCPAGGVRWLAIRGRAGLSAGEGHRADFMGTLQDITARKHADEQLRLSEFALSRASVGAAIISPEARFLRVNHAYCEMLGRPEADFVGLCVGDVNPEYPMESWQDHWAELRQSKTMRFETNLLHSSGHFVPVEIEINYLEFEGREYNFAFIRDITERRRTEDAIRASEARLTEAQRIGRVGSWEMNTDTGEVWCSDMMYELFGLPRPSAPHHFESFAAVVHPEDRVSNFAKMEPVMRGEVAEFINDFRVIRPDGRTIWISSRGRASRDETGRVVSVKGTDHDITDRKMAEETLRASEERLRSLITALAEGIVFQAETGEILDCNVNAEKILGLSRAQILGRTSVDPRWHCVHADGSPFPGEEHPAMVTIRTGRACTDVIMGVQKPDGTLTWISINAEPLIRDGEGRFYGVICSFSDITSRKETEDALRESEARLRLALSAARASAFVWNIREDEVIRYHDIDRNLTANPDRPDRIADVSGRVHPEDRDGFDVAVKRCLSGGQDYHNLYRLARPGMPVLWLEQSGFLERWPDGSPRRLTGVSVNVTERKVAEQALRESEARLRVALEAAATIAFVWDARTDSVIRYFSKDPALPANTDRPEPVAEVRRRVHPEDRDAFDRGVLECLERGNEYRNLYRVVRDDGSLVWLEEWGTLERDADGRPIRLTGISIDVTARRRAEEEVRESELRFRTLIETSSDGIFLLGLDGGIRLANPAAARMHGYAPDELLAMRMQDLDLPDSAAELPGRMRRLNSGETLTFEVNHRRKDGTEFPLEVLATTVVIAGEPLVLAFDRDITERKRTERLIRESETRYRTLIETSNDGVLLLAIDGSILSANRAAAIDNGYSVEELLGMNIRDLDVSDDPEEVAGRMRRLWEGESLTFEVTHRRRDGSRFPLEVSASAVMIDERRAIICFERDITERRRAEAALRDSVRRQRIALDAGRMGTWDWEVGSDRLVWDEREEQLFGFAPGEFDGSLTTFFGRIHAEDLPAVREVLEAARAGTDFDGEFRIVLPGGEVRWIHGAGTVVASPGKSPPRMVGINYDITERRSAELALAEEKSLLQGLFASLPGIVFAFDQQGRYIRWNHNYLTLLGWSDAEMATMSALDTVVPRDRERVAAVIREVFERGESATELYSLARDGREIPLFCSGVRTVLGRQPCVIGYGIDISARVAAERSLQLSESRLAQAQKIASLGYWESDLSDGLTWWSDEEFRIFGLTPGRDSLAGIRFIDLIHPDDREEHLASMERIRQTGEVHPVQYRIIRPDGQVRYVYEEARVVRREGEPPYLQGVSRDVTEQAEANLAVRSSLRDKEAMLKEIHHRVKNNLQVISSLLSLQAARATHPISRDVLIESQNRVRAMALVHESLYRSEDLAQVDVSRYLGELCGYLFRGYGVDSQRIRLELEVDPVTFPLDKTIPCGLIVNEIVSNSLKYAFPDDRPGCVRVSLRASDGLINLTLSDDGIGLPAGLDVENIPSLGLQLVTILTEQLGGRLAMDGNGGSTFVISFSP